MSGRTATCLRCLVLLSYTNLFLAVFYVPFAQDQLANVIDILCRIAGNVSLSPASFTCLPSSLLLLVLVTGSCY